MAGSRTLKLSILGDVSDLNKSLKTATADVDTFGDKMGKAGKAIGLAFAAAAAAAGAYAVKIGIDGVKAAIEDEKAQTQLALALGKATGATNAQIKATEDYILKTSLATGVSDDQLRPALQRIAISTGDVTKAQDLLATALDVSTATGKPLETVAAALSKGFDGNTAALGKLGIGLSAAELKTMSFEQVQAKLNETFGGAAAANAETYSGRIERMKIVFDEAKETIGYALLPVLEKLMKFIMTIAQPALDLLNKGFDNSSGLGFYMTQLSNFLTAVFVPVWDGLVSAFNSVKTAIGDNLDTFKTFFTYISTYLAPVIGTVLGGALTVVGTIAGGIVNVIAGVIKVINGLIGGAIDGINLLLKAYNAIPLLPNVPLINKPSISLPSAEVPKMPSTTVPSMTVPTIPSVTGAGAGGGVTTAAASGKSAATASKDVVVNVPSGGGEHATMATAVTVAPTINIGVAGDAEGVARTIVDVLNRSASRGTGGGNQLFIGYT